MQDFTTDLRHQRFVSKWNTDTELNRGTTFQASLTFNNVPYCLNKINILNLILKQITGQHWTQVHLIRKNKVSMEKSDSDQEIS